jgi:tetratricopeptide (TPR) repeat protein
MNLGCVLQSLQRIDEATTALRTAVQLDPGYGTAAWNLAQLLLLQGNFEEGLELFESRFSKHDPVPQPGVPAPLWHGESLIDKTIIITTEQAFGDAIQFVRYLPLLAQQGVRIILYNHLKPLQQLFRSVPGITAIIEDSTELPAADYQLPMLSLPRMFSTTLATIPNRMVPYLAPSTQKLALWGNKLAAVPGTKIGLCWAGRPEPDPRRSARLHNLGPLTQLDGAVFFSLQLDNGAEQSATPPPGMRLIDLTNDIHDFEDTAALITQLDLVISVDTSVAHLAGALGKPVFTLLPYSPDWRWLLGRQDCPWYPSMRLFRQQWPGDWAGVVNSMLIMIAQARLDADCYRTDHHTA